MPQIIHNDNFVKSDVTVVCTSNDKYIPPLLAFLNSIQANSPGINIMIRLVNVTEQHVDKVLSYNLRKQVIIDNVELSSKRTMQPNGLAGRNWKQLLTNVKPRPGGFRGEHQFQSDEACYCSNIKFNTANMALDDDNECVVYLDVDTIVRKDISSIKTVTQDHDMGMFVCAEELDKYETYLGQQYSGWHAGLMVVRNTHVAKQFYKELEQRVSENMFDIEADEDEFEYLVGVYKDDVSIKSLDLTYKDCGPTFNDDSVMWSGQAGIKATNDQYIKEFNKYVC